MSDAPGINELPPWFDALRKSEQEASSLRAEGIRLRAALEIAERALDEAECVIDADDQPDTFNKVSAARKLVRATL